MGMIEQIEAILTDPAGRKDRYGPDDEGVLTYIYGRITTAGEDDDTVTMRQLAKIRLAAYAV